MKNLINLYFHLEIKDNDQAFSLVKQSLAQIEQLEEAGILVEYLQLRATELPDCRADKEIWLKMDSIKGTYIVSDASVEWDQAFINAMKSVKKRMLHEETDYTMQAAIPELTLPLADYSLLAMGQY